MTSNEDWDSERHAQERARLLFCGYNEQQIEEIFDSVQRAGLAFDPDELQEMLFFVPLPQLRFERVTFKRIIDENKAIHEAIIRLDGLLRPRIECGDLCEGRFEQDYIGALYQEARPILVQIAKRACDDGAEFTNLMNITIDPVNSKRTVQNDLFKGIARLWNELGGEVRNTKAFRGFFEAVANPIYKSKYGKAKKLAWNQTNLVASCVKKWKEERD